MHCGEYCEAIKMLLKLWNLTPILKNLSGKTHVGNSWLWVKAEEATSKTSANSSTKNYKYTNQYKAIIVQCTLQSII
jgi:hypothetical protein